VTVSFDQANFGGGQGAAGKNIALNSAQSIWQRGTSPATANYSAKTFTADRWWALTGNASASVTVSRQSTSDTTNLPFIQYCTKIQRTSGNAVISDIYFAQDIESSQSIPFAGKTIVFSFYARKGADYTGASSALNFRVRSGTGTDQSMATGFTGNVNVINTTATLTATWQRFEATATVPTTATQLGIFMFYTPVGTASTNDFFEVTGIQLELGAVATPFQTATGTLQGELAACQRYFAKSYGQATAPATNSSANGLVFAQSGATVAASAYFANVPLPVTMRGNPTITIYSFTTSQTARVSDGSGTDLAASSGATNLINDSRFTVQNNSGGAITAATGGFVLHYTASAEL
jgi:hypothetical protein